MGVIPDAENFDQDAAEAVRTYTAVLAGVRSNLEEYESALRDEIEAAVQGIVTLTDRIETGAESVSAFAESFTDAVRKQVENAMADNADWNDAQDALRSQVEALSETIDTASERLQQLEELTESFDNQIDETMSEVLALQESLGETLIETVETATEKIGETSESLASFLTDLEESLEGVVESLDELMTSSADALGERLEDVMVSAVEAAGEELDALKALIANEAVPRVTQDVAATLVADLTGLIDDLLATFREALGGLRTQLFESSSQTGQSRAAVEAALDQMKVLMDPIQVEIGRIRGLASSVGMGF